MLIYKPLTPEINLAACSAVTSATNVGQGCLVRIINIDTSTNVLTFQYANAAQYANLSIAPSQTVIVWKNNTDLLLGTGKTLATQVVFKGI